MTTLTRRRVGNPHQESWHVYFGDVRVGHIGERAGVPLHVDQWGWSAGFYPGMHPGTHRRGTAESFEAARQAFEAAWLKMLPAIPGRAFDEWRRDRDWHIAQAAKRR